MTDCSLRSKTSYATTETFAVATSVFPVYPVYTSFPAEGVDIITVPVTVANPQATGVSPGSQSGSRIAGSASDAGAGLVHTTTIVVESCSDGDTCTGYINTIVDSDQRRRTHRGSLPSQPTHGLLLLGQIKIQVYNI